MTLSLQSPVRSLRELAGISQSELARRLAVDQSNIVRLESRGDHVQLDTLRRVAAACGVTLEMRAKRDGAGHDTPVIAKARAKRGV